jgi:hypothetical protein
MNIRASLDEEVQVTEDDNCPGPRKTGKTVIGTLASPDFGVSTENTKLV